MFGAWQVIDRVPLIARVLVAALPLAAAWPLVASGPAFPAVIGLPEGFAPEGIATGRGTLAYVGSLATGELVEIDLRTGEIGWGAPSPGPGAQAVGLKVDVRTNVLFVAASTFGARVYDASSGTLLQAYPFPPTGSGPVLINDVVVTRQAAYFTDSCSATIYVLPLGPGGQLPAPSDVQVLPLSGDFRFQFVPLPGYPCGLPNMNGIVASPDGDLLIVNNTATGELFRVDPATGTSVRIDILDAPFSTPFTDGLLLHGRTLYSVENFLNQIAVIELSQDFTTGHIVGYLSSPHFDVPSTAAFAGSGLYAVNARFRLDGSLPPSADDDVVRIGR